jgi:hypothetical protein
MTDSGRQAGSKSATAIDGSGEQEANTLAFRKRESLMQETVDVISAEEDS